MNDATDAIVMLENELDWKGAQVKELLIKLAMLLKKGTSVERWMDIAMDGEVSSDGDGRGDGSSDGRGNGTNGRNDVQAGGRAAVMLWRREHARCQWGGHHGFVLEGRGMHKVVEGSSAAPVRAKEGHGAMVRPL